MEIDDYLSKLNKDIENSLSTLRNDLGINEAKLDVSRKSDGDAQGYTFCPECGTRLPADARFCSNCGTKIVQDDAKDTQYGISKKFDKTISDETGESSTLHGIILTNTFQLAEKYSIGKEKVLNIINGFIDQAAKNGMEWHLLDTKGISDEGDDLSWEDYNDLVSKFIEEEDLTPSPDLHLFIIGGDDVIPIPRVEDPYEYGCDEIPTDMPYCFEGNFIPDFIEGYIEDLLTDDARNNVARLPLEDGEMETDIANDLQAYFNLSEIYADGIPVGNVVMESHYEWIPASTTMTEHLPLLYTDDDPEMVKNGMFISPKLLTDNEEALRIYKKSLEKADMLMFNLHGSDELDMSGFYSTDEAFAPSELYDSTARVLNTVACFGARYAGGYKRNQSMLLQALYGGGIMLYTGSLVNVPMYYDSNDENREMARQLLLNPGTGSEVFMRLYPIYQFQGMTAGKALLQAKCDYFNMCRYVESDTFSLSTMLMFCLYGNPMLHVKQQERVVEAALANDAVPPTPVKGAHQPVRRAMVKPFLTKEQLQQPKNVLSETSSAVDNNLRIICEQMAQNLYHTLGLPTRCLTSVSKVDRPDGATIETRYTFSYHDANAPYNTDVYAELNSNGKLKRLYMVK